MQLRIKSSDLKPTNFEFESAFELDTTKIWTATPRTERVQTIIKTIIDTDVTNENINILRTHRQELDTILNDIITVIEQGLTPLQSLTLGKIVKLQELFNVNVKQAKKNFLKNLLINQLFFKANGDASEENLKNE